MDDQVERMIKRTDGNNDTDRLVTRDGKSVARGRIYAHRNFYAMLMPQFLVTQFYTVNRTGHFNARVDQGFATFRGSLLCEILGEIRHQRRGFLEHR